MESENKLIWGVKTYSNGEWKYTQMGSENILKWRVKTYSKGVWKHTQMESENSLKWGVKTYLNGEGGRPVALALFSWFFCKFLYINLLASIFQSDIINFTPSEHFSFFFSSDKRVGVFVLWQCMYQHSVNFCIKPCGVSNLWTFALY
jgi:hypothetical protein